MFVTVYLYFIYSNRIFVGPVSSVGQSVVLITRMSWVRPPHWPEVFCSVIQFQSGPRLLHESFRRMSTAQLPCVYLNGRKDSCLKPDSRRRLISFAIENTAIKKKKEKPFRTKGVTTLSTNYIRDRIMCVRNINLKINIFKIFIRMHP